MQSVREVKNYYGPVEILDQVLQVGSYKTEQKIQQLLVMGFLAGAFIAFAAGGSNMAAYNLFSGADTYGLGRALAGAVFTSGLMFVLLAGGELFTGNMLIIGSVLEKKTTVSAMLRNWIIVYLANLIGSLFIVQLIFLSGLLSSGGGLLGGVTIKIAASKVGLTFFQALSLGILCNWLVCLAVWMGYGAKDFVGKMVAVFFPIMLFVTSGFEHCIANMYYIPMGIIAKTIPLYSRQALDLGVGEEGLEVLNWNSFLLSNLVPVTIGNIIGGLVFVGIAYWIVYKK